MPEVFYLIQVNALNEPVLQKFNKLSIKYNIINVSEIDVTKIINSLNSATIGQVYRKNYIDGELETKKRMTNYKRNFDIGLFYAPLFLTGNQLVLDKVAVGSYGLSFIKNFSQRHAIKFSLGGSFKMPNQKSIQSGMQSKIMTAVQNEEDTLFIDETIGGHFFFGGEISYRYSFNGIKPFRPYVALGIGNYTLNKFSGDIKDTVDISNVDMSDPSSMEDLIDPEGLEPTMENISARYVFSSIELGFEYRMSPVAKFNFSMPLRYFLDQSGHQSNTFSLGLNFGLLFCINPKKLPKLKQVSTK